MADDLKTKTCPICCMAIPAGAKLCPYCRRVQSKWARILSNPAAPGVVIAVFFAVMFGLSFVMFAGIFDQGEDFRKHADQLVILSSDMQLADEDGPTVAVLGRIRNDSDFDWKEIVFQVEFRNAEGKTVDVGQRHEYSYYLAREEVPFKVSFRREFPTDLYASHSIRIVHAREKRAFP